MRRGGASIGPPSERLAGLLAGDLPGHRRENDDGGRSRFIPVGHGPVLEVSARIERRFLGRTEIAVFETAYPVAMPEGAKLAITHSGRVKRVGLRATVKEGSDEALLTLVEAIGADETLMQASLPLDFTSFEVFGMSSGCRARIELMGASHVAIALPPIRSYVHLHPDQRESLLATLGELGRVLRHHARA